MKVLYLKDILNVIGDFHLSNVDNIKIKNVVDDSDDLESNTLLFHLRSSRSLDFDSFKKYHSYVIVVENTSKNSIEIKDDFIIVNVSDVRKAYWKFIKYYRDLFDIDVYAITGTCGKTTTKEMLSHILSEDHKVQATIRSKNANRFNLGYLTGIDDETDVAVFELGVSYYPGDLSGCCRYFSPTIGIITTIGIDHIKRCGSVENYIKAKGEMLEGLSYKGTLILNADDNNIKKIDLTPYKGRIIYFGKSANADFRIISTSYGKNGMDFVLRHDDIDYDIFVPGYGEHNVYNATAAITGAYIQGIRIKKSAKRLKSFKHIESHTQLFEGIKGCTIIDDTWSSNPLSVEMALDVLKNLGKRKNKIAVIGQMDLLGPETESEHKRIGKVVVEKGVDFLILRGDIAKIIGESALEHGMKNRDIIFCKDSEDVVDILKNIVDEDSIVLVKTAWYDDSTDLLKDIIIKK
ncbi:MAG: Mur ligase family protein [Clostridiaceae bacterium]